MTQSKIAVDGKFQTQKHRLLKTWDEIQRVQTDFCFLQEVSAYYMSEYWVNQAKSVLDVGVGNGYGLGKLQELFPQKKYTGVDISIELVELARSELGSRDVELKVQDFFEVTECYDFIITRLLWQHLPTSRLDEAFDLMERITAPGGEVMVVDAHDRLRLFSPELPKFRDIITAYTEAQLASGRNRAVGELIKQKAQERPLWKVGFDHKFILPSSIPGNLPRFQKIYELWLDLFEETGEVDMSFDDARSEICAWQQTSAAYTQAGLHVFRLDRTD